MKYLVNSPDAAAFLDTAQLDAGLNAILGDPKAIDANVGPDIQGAHIVLKDAAKKIAALVSDPTRTDVQKHAAAKQIAEKVTNHLVRSKVALEAHADKLKNTALVQAELQLGPRSECNGLYSEIRSWIREQVKTPDGLLSVRRAMAENDDVAAVLWHSPSFLIGMVSSVHETVRLDALRSRKPDLYTDLSNSFGITKLAGKYGVVINKVSSSFYNPELAGQASRRVEI